MGVLALNGGSPVHQGGWPAWPIPGPREEEALLEVLRSGKWWLNSMNDSTEFRDSGAVPESRVGRFEVDFSKAHDCAYGICTANGSVSLEVALRAAGIGPGDEVIVPPYTFIATAIAPLLVGAVTVFADIQLETGNIDPDAVRRALTARTRAIIPVHFAGRPAEMDEINQIATEHGLQVIEDSAHAHGASYRGRKCGSLGQIASFSFQGSKNITSGEGGILTTNSREYADLARSFVWGGRLAGSGWYGHVNMGSNLRLTEFQAAILSAQLENLPEWFERRARSAALLDDSLGAIRGVRPMALEDHASTHAYHVYMFRYDPQLFGGLSKQNFVQALQAEGLIVSGGYVYPLYKNRVFLERRFWGRGYPFLPDLYGPAVDYARFEALCPASERSCSSEFVLIPQPCLLADPESILSIPRAIEKVQLHCGELVGA